ncbi:transporter [Ulvibacter sp. MAR_2010_11]|uniref:transporter n=1 Tax=Ulvibacter sp. MAR_2010_11 TaxID=1250229 RepID=UPI000C2BCF36|nr:transporter [Ulvibacter sp. MAR_2010_11]
MNYLKHFFLVSFIGAAFGIQAQEKEETADLITDRPDATESPNTVPKGSIQLETGAFYESYKNEGIQDEILGYNTTLVRYGLLNNFELRVGWNFEEGRTSLDGTRISDVSSGFSPLLLGMKVEITEEKGLLPDIGLLGHLMLPFLAATDYRPETTGVDFRFSFAHTINEKSGIAYNLGAQWGDDSSEVAYVYTLVYGFSISEKIGIYAEVYGDFPEDSKANHYWDTGLTYALQKNIQLDATFGRSFTEGQDILVSAGLSLRLPN